MTDDFELWHPLGQMLLLGLMFVGGCTGSTSGGLKVARLLLLIKVVDREFKRMVNRRGVFAVRLGSRVIPESTVQSLLILVYIAAAVILSASLLLASMGVDVLTSLTAAIAAVFNIGPAFGGVGAVRQLRLAACRSQMGLECLYDCRSPRVLLRARSADALVLAQVGGAAGV